MNEENDLRLAKAVLAWGRTDARVAAVGWTAELERKWDERKGETMCLARRLAQASAGGGGGRVLGVPGGKRICNRLAARDGEHLHWRRYPESPCNPSVFVHTGTFSRSLRRGFGNLAELYRLRPGEVVWGLPQHHIFELIHGHREWAEEMKRGGWPCRDYFPTAIQFEGLQSWEGPGPEPGVCVLKATYFSRPCGHVSRMVVLMNISNRSFFDAVLRGMALRPEAVIGVSSPCDGEERASDECFEWAAHSGAGYFYSDVDSGGKLRELIHADGRYAEVGFIKEHHWMPREDVCCWMRQEEEVGQS